MRLNSLPNVLSPNGFFYPSYNFWTNKLKSIQKLMNYIFLPYAPLLNFSHLFKRFKLTRTLTDSYLTVSSQLVPWPIRTQVNPYPGTPLVPTMEKSTLIWKHILKNCFDIWKSLWWTVYGYIKNMFTAAVFLDFMYVPYTSGFS